MLGPVQYSEVQDRRPPCCCETGPHDRPSSYRIVPYIPIPHTNIESWTYPANHPPLSSLAPSLSPFFFTLLFSLYLAAPPLPCFSFPFWTRQGGRERNRALE